MSHPITWTFWLFGFVVVVLFYIGMNAVFICERNPLLNVRRVLNRDIFETLHTLSFGLKWTCACPLLCLLWDSRSHQKCPPASEWWQDTGWPVDVCLRRWTPAGSETHFTFPSKASPLSCSLQLRGESDGKGGQQGHKRLEEGPASRQTRKVTLPFSHQISRTPVITTYSWELSTLT